jgi:glycosyltransferase 2 family protein
MKRILVGLLKVGISLGLIAFLIWNATRGEAGGKAFTDLRDQPKDWGLLFAAWAISSAAILTTFVRWWILVRALDVPCRFRDVMRISFWGFLFNFSPFGIGGGDVVKAVMLAHEQKAHRPKAVASVMVDRFIGLYVIFVMASTAILATGFWKKDAAGVWPICIATFAITAAGGVGIIFLLASGQTGMLVCSWLARIPRVGKMLANLVDAVNLYRHRRGTLLLASVMTLILQVSFVVVFYLIARGLYQHVPSLVDHFVLVPLGTIMRVIPINTGPMEGGLDFLYALVGMHHGQGLVVALGYRIIEALFVPLGIYYYFTNRGEVRKAIQEESEEAEQKGKAEFAV